MNSAGFNIGDQVQVTVGCNEGKKGRVKERTSNGNSYFVQCEPEGVGWYSPSDLTLVASIDPVNHPIHYGGDIPHEAIKCLHAWGLEDDALLWNAAKYISRAGKKGDALEDLHKAGWYIQRRIERETAKRERGAAG